MFIHLHLCGFYPILCQSLWVLARIPPGLAFADPALHLGLLVVVLVVGVVPPACSSCYHGSWLACGVVGRVFCIAKRAAGYKWAVFMEATMRCWPRRIREGGRMKKITLHVTKPGLTLADGWLAIKKTLLWISKRSKKTGRIYHPVSKPWSPSSSWTGWTWAGCAEPGCRRESRCNNGPTARPLPAGCWNAAGGLTSATWLSQSRRKSLSGLNLNWVCSGAVLDDLMSQ